jgi:hypothetical protein
MQLRKALHHTFNAAATFVGAVGMAVCIPLFTLSALGFPNGPSSVHPDEVGKYGLGAAGATAVFVTGYRRKILPEKGPQQPKP